MAVVDSVTRAKKKDAALPSRGRAPSGARRRKRRTPVTWVRGGGLTTLAFLLPLLFVFGAFSWYPIVRLVTMSLQHTNLVTPATWVGLDNFRKVLDDPLLPIAVRNTLKFALLALVFGYPIPLVAAVPRMSEARRFWRRLRGPRLPAGRDSAGRLGAAVEDVLRRLSGRRLQHHARLGRHRAASRGCSRLTPRSRRSCSSPPGPTRARRSSSTSRLSPGSTASCTRRRRSTAPASGTRSFTSPLPQLRGVMLITMILQIIGTAQVFIEPYLFTQGGPANATLTVMLLIYDYAFGNSLGGDYGKATAPSSLMLAAFLALCSVIYLRATRSWSTT